MLKIENIDLETEMQQRQKAGEYFADLTDSLSVSLDTFITKTNSLMEDGNANPAIFDYNNPHTPQASLYVWAGNDDFRPYYGCEINTEGMKY